MQTGAPLWKIHSSLQTDAAPNTTAINRNLDSSAIDIPKKCKRAHPFENFIPHCKPKHHYHLPKPRFIIPRTYEEVQTGAPLWKPLSTVTNRHTLKHQYHLAKVSKLPYMFPIDPPTTNSICPLFGTQVSSRHTKKMQTRAPEIFFVRCKPLGSYTGFSIKRVPPPWCFVCFCHFDDIARKFDTIRKIYRREVFGGHG